MLRGAGERLWRRQGHRARATPLAYQAEAPRSRYRRLLPWWARGSDRWLATGFSWLLPPQVTCTERARSRSGEADGALSRAVHVLRLHMADIKARPRTGGLRRMKRSSVMPLPPPVRSVSFSPPLNSTGFARGNRSRWRRSSSAAIEAPCDLAMCNAQLYSRARLCRRPRRAG